MLVNYTVRDIDNMGYHCKLTIIYTSNQPSSCSMKSTTKFIHIWWAVGFKNSGGSEMFSGSSLHQKITFQQDTSRTNNISYLTWTWAPPQKKHMVPPPKSTNKQPSFLQEPPNNGSPLMTPWEDPQLPTNGEVPSSMPKEFKAQVSRFSKTWPRQKTAKQNLMVSKHNCAAGGVW